ncbi:hypothetical protein [Streptomyces sp. KR80]|uniref:hypothetical protein n=1 Tax=Streptomyces sp. KR80 TaxID=3457426 RepID=UPI003FD545BF
MRKLQKVAVVAAMVGSAGFVGAGPAAADDVNNGPEFDVKQTVSCQGHDTNTGIISNIGVLNGNISGLFGNEGDTGNTTNKQGSTQACWAKALSS